MPVDLPPLRPALERIVEFNSGKTHWPGCEREHLLCAAQMELERYEKALRLIAKVQCWSVSELGESPCREQWPGEPERWCEQCVAGDALREPNDAS